MHRISIIPRGQALGYTLNLPEEDRYLKTREELMDYMVVLLGGRVTEHLVFGQVTTGASDDLRKVHEISRSMVTDYGMGTELQSKQLPADDYSMSDATRRMIDEEQQYLTDLAHRRALQIVAEHRALLEAFAFTLLENEVLERDDIDRIMAPTAEHRRGRRAAGPRGRSAPRGRGAWHPAPAALTAAGARNAAGAQRRKCRKRPALPGTHRSPDSAPVFERIDHIGVAVEDLDGAIELYRDRLGMPHQHRETVEQFGVEAVLLGVGEAHVELLAPDSSPRAGWPVPRPNGPGCTTWPTRTDDIDAALDEARGRAQLIDEEPRTGIRESRVAFVHPKSTGGVLTELVQPAEDH